MRAGDSSWKGMAITASILFLRLTRQQIELSPWLCISLHLQIPIIHGKIAQPCRNFTTLFRRQRFEGNFYFCNAHEERITQFPLFIKMGKPRHRGTFIPLAPQALERGQPCCRFRVYGRDAKAAARLTALQSLRRRRGP